MGKWLIHGSKHRKENESQSLKYPLQNTCILDAIVNTIQGGGGVS